MISGHVWRAADSSRVVITRQIQTTASPDGYRWLIYQTCLATYERVANWDGFMGINAARSWVRSRTWPGVIEVVEN